MLSWPVTWPPVRRSWGGGRQCPAAAVAIRLVVQWLWQEMGRLSLLMWPRTRLAFVCMARVHGERLNVVDQSCQFPARRTKDAMMHLGGHGLNLTEKFSEGCRLPHEGSACVFTRP